MKKLLLTLSMAVAMGGLGVAPFDVEAKRLGGGKPAGLQRQMPATPAKPATPPSPAQAPGTQPAGQQAAPAMAGAAAAAAAPAKRSWMGPIAGLAAGLGLAALFSHFGMGEGLANFVMIALLALAAFMVLRFVMGRLAARRQGGTGTMGAMGGYNLAGAAAGAGAATGPAPMPRADSTPAPVSARSTLEAAPATGAAAPAGATLAAASPAAAAPALPDGIDAADFLRLAKTVFIRLQAANDAANVDDLRKFTTPELFASLRLDLQERGPATQQTDVVQLEAEIADVTRDGMGQDVVSVRYSGLIREQADGGAEPFAELWHLVRPAGGEWAIAGITPQ